MKIFFFPKHERTGNAKVSLGWFCSRGSLCATCLHSHRAPSHWTWSSVFMETPQSLPLSSSPRVTQDTLRPSWGHAYIIAPLTHCGKHNEIPVSRAYCRNCNYPLHDQISFLCLQSTVHVSIARAEVGDMRKKWSAVSSLKNYMCKETKFEHWN